MSLSKLPNEIFTQIVTPLSFNDNKNCMSVNHEWHSRFRTFFYQSVHITTTEKFQQFFKQLEETDGTQKPLGLLVLRLTLGDKVELTQDSFERLPLYCPNLEYLDFNKDLWENLRYTDTHEKKWIYLKRHPKILWAPYTKRWIVKMGKNITQLVLHLHDSPFSFTYLQYTPNLISLEFRDTHLARSDTRVSVIDFESLHRDCPHLESLLLHYDFWRIPDDSTVDIETVSAATNMKSLTIKSRIGNRKLLPYWGHKYSNIETFDLDLWGWQREYPPPVVANEDYLQMKEALDDMMTKFPHLKKLNVTLNNARFPCESLLQGVCTSGARLENLSITYSNFDHHPASLHSFKTLLTQSMSTLTRIGLADWKEEWDFEADILGSISQCPNLEQLSLKPYPGQLTEFYIDVVLDACPRLQQLELERVYTLFVRGEPNYLSHPLESLILRQTTVNDRLFDYIAARCPNLNNLELSNVIKPYDNEIQVNINMPAHVFKSISIDEMHLGLRLEDNEFQCKKFSTLVSLEEDRHPERWYHIYKPRMIVGPVSVQELTETDAERIRTLHMTDRLWCQLAFASWNSNYREKENWFLDIPYGYFSVRCKSVDKFTFDKMSINK